MDKDTIELVLSQNLNTTKCFVQMLFDNLKKEIDNVRNENVKLKETVDCVVSLRDKVTALEVENEDLKRSLEFSHNEIYDLKSKYNELSLKLSATDTEVNGHRPGTDFSSRLRNIEDYTRRKNVRIFGILDSSSETQEQAQVKVQNVIANKLNLPNVKILTASRIGAFGQNSDHPRQILVKLSTVEEKVDCFKNSSKLKGSNIYINEDVSAATLEIRKSKMPELLQKRRDGYYAYFSGTKIVSKRRTPPTDPTSQVSSGNSSPSLNRPSNDGPIISASSSSSNVPPNVVGRPKRNTYQTGKNK